ncbi:hypothetical protein HC028_26785 [Planosporangium flavigriseum]|uniref:hypothetical protein n=1 Tax=Planosporangium flavigriseum TaxID=373681 RepID=UPI001439A60B|nr:hypothetical protein [Planosporangium flavigriseum]NJC68081.1 hypothetical protein [Planosporangium flavigriseum]
MSISDDEATRIRRTRAYRSAVWTVRLGLVLVVVWGWLVFVTKPTDSVLFMVWLAAGLLSVCALVLLRRSGVRFARRGLSWHVEDDRVIRQFYRDVYWFRR